ncbi:MAG: efflux RND transporter permease subunit, partial [Planctomycetes bacterium]|nr:efflux RND transporter permease subunit [Planctomycetota bacterium]
MAFIQFAIRNPVKVAVGVILAVMFGMISYFATPVQLTPDVDEPEITVTTRWPGASAQEVEREIIDEQEEQLKSVEGLRKFKSVSSDSVGTIVLTFKVGTDLGESSAKVRDKLNQVPEYPENAKEPVITTVNPNANAIAWFILKPITPTATDLRAFVAVHPELQTVLEPMIAGTQPIELSRLASIARTHPKVNVLVLGKNDPAKMKKFAEDFIEARFERVTGVANANVLGGRDEEFRIVVDPQKLAAFGLTIADLNRALRAENKNTSGGDIREGKNRIVIRTIGQFDSPEKVAETIIVYRDNAPIRVRDVARVGVEYKKTEGVVRQKGINALAINAQQAPGTNLLEVMGPPVSKLDLNGDGVLTQLELSQAKRLFGDSLRIAAAELNIGRLKQKGLYLEQVYDQTDYLNSATDLVRNNIFIGGSLAMIVLLVFLRSIRSLAIVAVAIPISVIATFLFIRGFGRSINVISLAGMAFAVGMVVDNAIVVLENIFRHYQSGKDPEEASSKGAMEVWGAVLASTLTTLAVFIPVIFVEGQAGQLFRDIAIAISCAVGLSLIVSITVIPTAARRILRQHPSMPDTSGNGSTTSAKSWRMFGLLWLCQTLTDRFAQFIGRLQTMRGSFAIRIVIVVFFITASLSGAWMLRRQTEYLPDGNRNLVIAMLKPPPGYNVEKLISLGEEFIEPHLEPYWEAAPGSPEEAALNGPRIDNFFFVARGPMLFMGANSVDPLRAGELVPVMQEAVSKVPGVFGFATQSSLFESAITGGRNIDIEITGPDLEVLVTEAKKVMRLCMQYFPRIDPETGAPTGHQVQPSQNLELSSPELHVIPRREKAAELGINTRDLGYVIDALVDGAYAGDYWHDGRKIDLVIYGADEFTRHTHDLENLPISTPSGQLVTVSSVAEIKLVGGPEQVAHSERVRSITLQLKPGPQMPLEQALEIVNEKIRKPMMQSPAFEGGLYQIRLTGTADKLHDT